MSARVQALRAQLLQLGQEIERAITEEFPIGARVRWTSHGINNRIGRVELYCGMGCDTYLCVRAERTGRLVDVRMREEPEVLPE